MIYLRRLTLTSGAFANTCAATHFSGSTQSPFTGSVVSGPVSLLSFSSCDRPVTVHKAGSMSIEHIAGTTNGTLRSSGAEFTVGSPIGTLTCVTGASTHLGILTGSAAGKAEIDINAILNCGFLAPSAKWESTWVSTSPEPLAVSA